MTAHRAAPAAFMAACTLLIAGACAPSDQSAGEAAGSPSAASNKGQAYVQDPNSRPNILGIALNSPDHTTLVAAVQAAALENVLVNAGPLTVFAPVNAAFEALPAGTLDELLKPENKSRLGAIVTSHAAPGKFTLDRLTSGLQLYMATGHHVSVEVREDGTYVNGARILATVEATNGVVHVVDQVFLIAAG